MQEELNIIVSEVREKASQVVTRAGFEAYKATISGPNGSLTEVMKGMGKIPKEEKPAMGKLINEAKTAVSTEFDAVIERLEAAELAAKLGPDIDPTLPCPDQSRGTIHPIAQVRDEMVNLFRRIGFPWPKRLRSKRSTTASTRSIFLPTTRPATCRIPTTCRTS
jgi:phenylalanyl-tRNA synthetase alpha chain